MKKLLLVSAGAFFVLSCYGVARADAPPASPYEYTADEIAENQGVVAYWYAWGYSHAFGQFPEKFAELSGHGLPLRDFFSPHTGNAVNFDDGTLDFDGDMLYAVNGGYPEIQIQTTTGMVVLPGILSRTNECLELFCCEVTICKSECWETCDDEDAACRILQWMMWKSFELHECRYGYRPVDETAWVASGLAPIDLNWRARAPYMEIELIYGKCSLNKAYVSCCSLTPKCKPCASIKPCGNCDERKPKCVSAGNKCKQDTCSTCKPAASKDNCRSCKPKARHDSCGSCKPIAEQQTSNACKPDRESKCSKCKQASCTTCKPKSSCDKCRSA